MVLSRVDESTRIDSKNDRWVDTDRDSKIFWKVSDFKKFRLLEIFFYFVSNKNRLVFFFVFFRKKDFTDFWELIRCWIPLSGTRLGKISAKVWVTHQPVYPAILEITRGIPVRWRNFYTDMGNFRVFEFRPQLAKSVGTDLRSGFKLDIQIVSEARWVT